MHVSTANGDSSYRNLQRAIRDSNAVILVRGIGSANMQSLVLVLCGGRFIDIEVGAGGQVLYSQLWVCIVGDAMLIKGAVSVDVPDVQMQ